MHRSLSPLSTLFVALLPLVLVLSACDSGGSNDNAVNNEFTLTIEPQSNSSSAAVEAQQEEVNGFSFFYDGEDPNTGEQVFGIYLSNEESFSEQSASDELFGFFARDSGQPSSGTYSFTDDPSGNTGDFGGVLYKDIGDFQSAPFYVIDSGTLNLETSNDDEVAGSIQVSGTKFIITESSIEQEPVSITGEFSAKNVETFAPLNTPGL